MSGKPANIKLNRAFTIAEVVVAGLFTLAFLTAYVLTGACVFRLGLCAVWLLFTLFFLVFRKEKQNFILCIAEILFISPVVIFLALWAPIMYQTHFAFRYPFQKAYIGIFNGDDTFDYFPSKLPDGIRGYRLDYLPSILQGDGYTTMSFEAPDAVIEQYTEMYSKDAIFVCTVAELGRSSSIMINENGANTTNKYADVRMDKRFKAKCSDNAVVYIMYNSETSHRSPHTSAVVIDRENNIIEFSKIG